MVHGANKRFRVVFDSVESANAAVNDLAFVLNDGSIERFQYQNVLFVRVETDGTYSIEWQGAEVWRFVYSAEENAIESMNFSLPITLSDLSGKEITMRSNVTLKDCKQHLKAKDGQSRSWYVNQGGQLTDGGYSYNSVECYNNVITFEQYDDLVSLIEITWE